MHSMPVGISHCCSVQHHTDPGLTGQLQQTGIGEPPGVPQVGAPHSRSESIKSPAHTLSTSAVSTTTSSASTIAASLVLLESCCGSANVRTWATATSQRRAPAGRGATSHVDLLKLSAV
jgi:hypothetical protein